MCRVAIAVISDFIILNLVMPRFNDLIKKHAFVSFFRLVQNVCVCVLKIFACALNLIPILYQRTLARAQFHVINNERNKCVWCAHTHTRTPIIYSVLDGFCTQILLQLS